uniref:RING finger domain-containing protein n=1 Tax=Gasterosteus aculeatus aculeatus TaxID=481459 RepID=UPI001A983979|nr:RING finger domain-containing protein [Gasterosteus aculeatus aculeatus]XP_040036225.1 RING finger domain-containing protein [Gasterosteus aculeatus aculeatus]
MMGGVVPAAQQGGPSLSTATGEPADVECPVCYQEYNQHNKCPRMLECLHVFCTECLGRIQLCSLVQPPEAGSTPALPCPLCRHLTPLETGNALCLPRNSRILARLPPAASRLPSAGQAARLATVTQRVVLSLEGDGRDSRFIILPTVSLRVQQMHPGRPCGAAPGLAGEDEVIRQSRKTLFCVQLLAVTFWVLFVIACVGVVMFGPHIFNTKH